MAIKKASGNIVQWNCRGLSANRQEFELLVQKYDAPIICLQETLLKNDKMSLKGYTPYHEIGTVDNMGRAHGGTSIFVKDNLPQSEVTLNTGFQTVAARITLHMTLTICSIYIPPGDPIDFTHLNSLIKQLPRPYILLGDFNAHSSLWGGRDNTDRKGRVMERFMTINDLCLWNNDSPTYLHPATGSLTSIDLTMCSPALFMDYTWVVEEDQHGSDHFPIILRSNFHPPDERQPRWQFHKADWETFRSLCEDRLCMEDFEHAEHPIEGFTEIVLDIASHCIPQSTPNPKRPTKPWFSEECKQAIRKRKKALRDFKKQPTQYRLQQYLLERARARQIIRNNKKKSWQDYVSKLNTRSSMKKCWDMVRKISGKGGARKVKHIIKNGNSMTDPKDIANTLGETISQNSSVTNYSPKFQHIQNRTERHKLRFPSDNLEAYNQLFSINELGAALDKSHDTAPGPDQIHYQILKHLPDAALLCLLTSFNRIWDGGAFPPSWREATIIPIPKPDKDSTNANNYRPIALTSCICKTMERMINNRLVWFLESSAIITEAQSGFRKTRSTIDHLVRLETFVREGFVKKEHVVSVFFDLEKAYDTTWKYGIMKDLHDMGLRGRLPHFIKSFLSERVFKVRVGTTLSDFYDQEMGVPQGSILSVTLFLIKINSIASCIKPGVDCSLFVDDFGVCYRSRSMQTIERKLQQHMYKIQEWADNNGFKFSQTKTVCMHFCQRRKVHPDPQLQLNHVLIPVVKEHKFLGIILDSKLSFLPHIKHLKKKCQKALNLLRVVSNTDWGGDQTVLLRLYRAFVRSKLDYGCIVYGSARSSYVQMLDPIQNQGLRLCLGAFRTSPADSLEVEADEMPLTLRREKLTLQYVSRVASNPSNPAYDSVFKLNHVELFRSKPRVIPSLGVRVQESLEALGFDPDHVAKFEFPETPPWTYVPVSINLSMSAYKKDGTASAVFKSAHSEVRANHANYKFIYTDGSFADDKAAAAAVLDGHAYIERLPDRSSIFSAELHAIFLALDHIETSDEERFVVFSDSKSVLQALQGGDWKNPLLCKVLERLHHLSTYLMKRIEFYWIPSHIGIRGNDEADAAAKSGLTNRVVDMPVPYGDFKRYINEFIKSKWQQRWDEAVNNKLHEIRPNLDHRPSHSVNVRREERVLSRIRIGHSHITHCYLLRGEDTPECIPCDCRLTVRHILTDCVDLAAVRTNYFNDMNLKDLFDTVPSHLILSYLREINLFYKI